jgi:hypothetical protein
MANKKTMRNRKGGNPKIYYSSTAIRAVSNDGGKKWHIDADINGEKRHTNLTKHDMDNNAKVYILYYVESI